MYGVAPETQSFNMIYTSQDNMYFCSKYDSRVFQIQSYLRIKSITPKFRSPPHIVFWIRPCIRRDSLGSGNLVYYIPRPAFRKDGTEVGCEVMHIHLVPIPANNRVPKVCFTPQTSDLQSLQLKILRAQMEANNEKKHHC